MGKVDGFSQRSGGDACSWNIDMARVRSMFLASGQAVKLTLGDCYGFITGMEIYGDA